MTINGNEISPAITPAERNKLVNTPDNTTAELALKSNLSGGNSFSGTQVVNVGGHGIRQIDNGIEVGTFISETGGWIGTASNHNLNLFVDNGSPLLTIDSTTDNVSITNDLSVGGINSANNFLQSGAQVVDGENWGSIIDNAIYYFDTFPILTNADISSWAGKDIYFLGTGVGTITFPQISNSATTSQIRAGTTFTIHNFNSGSDLTIAVSGADKFVIDNITNVSTANQSIFSSSAIRISALDLNAYGTVGSFAFLYSGIS